MRRNNIVVFLFINENKELVEVNKKVDNYIMESRYNDILNIKLITGESEEQQTTSYDFPEGGLLFLYAFGEVIFDNMNGEMMDKYCDWKEEKISMDQFVSVIEEELKNMEREYNEERCK